MSVPTGRLGVLIEAEPALSWTVDFVVLPIANVTVPVGANPPLTVAVRVTNCPEMVDEGDATTVVVVDALLTVSSKVAWLIGLVPSPL